MSRNRPGVWSRPLSECLEGASRHLGTQRTRQDLAAARIRDERCVGMESVTDVLTAPTGSLLITNHCFHHGPTSRKNPLVCAT